jgi:ABC-2 type transport system permease protein
MTDAWCRIRALARKDLEEVRQQPGLILPAAAMVLGLSVPAFMVLIVLPIVDGDRSADAELAKAARAAGRLLPDVASLSASGQAQAFLLQQFLVFSLMVPVLGALALASQSLIGEKQSRALEPLLATPIATWELLTAKVLTPFALSIVLLACNFLLYLAGMATMGEPGVWRALFWPRTLVVFGLIGPLFAMTALAGAAIISSRVNDARTAQQLGSFIMLPVTALFVAQIAGQFLLGYGALALVAAVLVAVNVLLVRVGVRVFQRETILMRWK